MVNYSTYNKGYFKYCGSPLTVSKKEYTTYITFFTSIETDKLDKRSNIITHINFSQTDSDSNLSPLSPL